MQPPRVRACVWEGCGLVWALSAWGMRLRVRERKARGWEGERGRHIVGMQPQYNQCTAMMSIQQYSTTMQGLTGLLRVRDLIRIKEVCNVWPCTAHKAHTSGGSLRNTHL
jgi:hypothetical protein